MSLNIEMPTVCAQLRGMVVGGKGYGISHSWDGTVLTVTSDSGSSSADLAGPAGPAGPAGTELFVVELRLENGVYVADKTFAEVKAAIDAGDVVVCDFIGADSRTRCPLTTYTDYSATFVLQSVLGADEYFYITAEGVTHMVEENEEEEAPSQVSVMKTDSTVAVTAAYADGSSEVTTITLDGNGDPVSVTKDGQTTTLTWEGFDE